MNFLEEWCPGFIILLLYMSQCIKNANDNICFFLLLFSTCINNNSKKKIFNTLEFDTKFIILMDYLRIVWSNLFSKLKKGKKWKFKWVILIFVRFSLVTRQWEIYIYIIINAQYFPVNVFTFQEISMGLHCLHNYQLGFYLIPL